MRVALGTTVLEQGLSQGGLDGIGNYSRELLTHLKRLPLLDVQPYVFSGAVSPDRNASILQAGSFGAQALFALTTGRPLPGRMSAFAGRFDLVHATDHLIPCISKIPVIATLMDAIPLSHPEWVNYSLKGLKNAFWKRSTRWASHVLTISEYSRQELIEWFGIPERRISVTPLGVEPRWFVAPSPAQRERVRQLYQLPSRYFLFVGTLQPRKNVARLIAAHQMLAPALRREFPLVVVGRAGWACEKEVQALSDGDHGCLRWLNYVPDEDLLPLVSQASALTFPSLHEGFGLPVLEAFAAGVPVITSNSTSLPEVAGSAALLIDPMKVAEIADAMNLLLTDDAVSEKLRKLGRERATRFTWESTAKLTQGVYQQVCESF